MRGNNDQAGQKANNDENELEALLQKIFDERAMDFRSYKRPSLKRLIKKRLDANHQATYEEYMKLLESKPEEYTRLFDALLINVTRFFRDHGAFESLEKVMEQIISNKKKGDSIRIWSAGCASGEEPYSLGILLAEKLGDTIDDYEIKIYATDIDDKVLIEARRGAFSEDKLKNIKHEYIDKYFFRENGYYKISKIIRQMVIFGKQNLVTDAPISHLDLIVCRNVLIYFNLDLQKKLVIRFHYGLNKDGYLLLGKSESMLMGSKLFVQIDSKWKIFQKSSGVTLELERRGQALEENIIDQAIRNTRNELKAMDLYSQSIIQNISLGIIVIDKGNLVTTWNHTSEDIWHIKAENAIGHSFFELGMIERLPGFREQIDEIIRKRRKIHEEMEVTDYRGEKRLIDFTFVPLMYPNEVNQGVIIITSDVSEGKKLKDELKKSNEELQSLNVKLETTNQELQFANEELETTSEELQSTNEELETTNEELQSTNEELETTNEELKERTVQLDSMNLYNENIIQNVKQSLVILNIKGIVTTLNPAAQEMWGIKEKDAIGSNFFSLDIERFMTSELIQNIKQVIEDRKTYHETAHEYFTLSGEKRFMELSIVPLIDLRGDITGTMLLSQDVTEEKKVHDMLETLVQERTEDLRRTNQALQAEIIERKRVEEQIQTSLKEKELLLREIHHRVKNNMQIISSLLNLQSKYITEDKYRGLFEDCQNKIRSMSLIHEKLYYSEDLSRVNFKEYVIDLVNNLFRSYDVNKSAIISRINIENASVGIDFAIPCGLIINELITNSLKHAFPDGRKGEIRIALSQTNENIFELFVGDNGIGIPENIDIRNTESLGLRLVTMLVNDQLEGEIEVKRNKGTEFIIKFKRVN